MVEPRAEHDLQSAHDRSLHGGLTPSNRLTRPTTVRVSVTHSLPYHSDDQPTKNVQFVDHGMKRHLLLQNPELDNAMSRYR